MVCFLLYITLGIRLDIIYVVIKLSRFTSNSNEIHFIAVKRVFKYLKTTIKYGITYFNKFINNKFIINYYNADYIGDLYIVKSTSGYIFLLAGGLISWKSKL